MILQIAVAVLIAASFTVLLIFVGQALKETRKIRSELFYTAYTLSLMLDTLNEDWNREVSKHMDDLTSKEES